MVYRYIKAVFLSTYMNEVQNYKHENENSFDWSSLWWLKRVATNSNEVKPVVNYWFTYKVWPDS